MTRPTSAYAIYQVLLAYCRLHDGLAVPDGAAARHVVASGVLERDGRECVKDGGRWRAVRREGRAS